MPGVEDTATFNATSNHNSTVDEGFAGSIATVKINAGYTGTISLARSLAVTTSFTQATGTFTAGSQALMLKALTLTGGSFTASSGTTSLSGALKISGSPSFNANGGTLNLNGTASATLSCNSVTFNLVTITSTAGTKTLGSDCSLPLGASPTAGSGGSIALNGTLSGSGTLTTSKTLTLGAGGSLSGFSGLVASTLTVSGSYDFSSYSPFTVTGVFTVTEGASFTAPAGTASFASNFSVSSAAEFDANEGTVVFSSKVTFKVSCGGQTFNAVSFESSGHKTIASDCTLPLGEDPSLGTAGGTTLNGTLVGSGTLTQIGTFEIGSASPGLDSFTDVFDNGSFLMITGAAVTAPEGTLTVQGNFTIGSGTEFAANKGTVNFQALPKTTKTIACDEATFNLVTFTNTSKQVVNSDCTLPLGANPEIGEGGQIVLDGELTGSGTLTANSLLFTLGPTGSLAGFTGLETGALTVEGAYDFSAYEPFAVSGDFSLSPGAELTAPEGTAKFAGDFANGGTFKANEGTVELNGTGQALSGSTTFENLTKIAEAKETLTFAAGATQTVKGTLTLEGASAEKLLSLVSSSSGTPWLLAGEGPREVRWVSVKDSTNTGTEISTIESTDKGGNTGWAF